LLQGFKHEGIGSADSVKDLAELALKWAAGSPFMEAGAANLGRGSFF
jgi:hypothetical protein